MNVSAIEACRSCKSKDLISILSLGNQYVSDFIDSLVQQIQKLPLELVLCDAKNGGCGLLQLRHTTPRELLYRQYWYRSGINQTMKDALADITGKAESLIRLDKRDIVLDIGSNDSTLLRSYKTDGLELVGFEPARNLMAYAGINNGMIINDFFSYELFQKFFGNRKAKIITSIAMFYDLDDPNIFVEDAKKCLDDKGLWIIQMNYLPSMLQQNAFDNIGHEHLEYYSLYSLENLIERHGLEVFDIEFNDINGGSFRTYIKHVGAEVKSSPGSESRVNGARKFEQSLKLDDLAIYEKFASGVSTIKETLYNFIRKETEKGKRVYVYGASTRGNTLLQYCNLDNSLIKSAAERNPDKWGKLTVGSLIPIISEDQARAERPDYFLMLPWAFIKEFIEREREFLQSGGKFIVPLPEFRVIEANDLKHGVHG